MSTATDMLQLYIDAEKAVLSGQMVKLNGRTLERVNLEEIRAGRLEWQRSVDSENRISAGGSSMRHQLPDFSS